MSQSYRKKSYKIIILWAVILLLLLVVAFFAYEKYVMGGGFACKQLSETQTKVGSWIALDKNEITLEPFSNEVIPFSISVPSNVVPGEHNGCLLVQEKDQVEDNAKQNLSGISLSMRTGVRIALTVPGDLHQEITINGFSIERTGTGGRQLLVEMLNKGNISTNTDISVKVQPLFGKPVATDGGTFSILPNEQTEFRFGLPSSFWGGIYQAELNASYKAEDEKEEFNSAASQCFVMWPSLAGATIELAMILVALSLFFIIIFRRRRARKMTRTWERQMVRGNVNIQDLAKKFDVPWKDITRVNRLKPPYAVSDGDVLLLPVLPPPAHQHHSAKKEASAKALGKKNRKK